MCRPVQRPEPAGRAAPGGRWAGQMAAQANLAVFVVQELQKIHDLASKTRELRQLQENTKELLGGWAGAAGGGRSEGWRGVRLWAVAGGRAGRRAGGGRAAAGVSWA